MSRIALHRNIQDQKADVSSLESSWSNGDIQSVGRGQPFARTPVEEIAVEGSAEHEEGQRKAEMVGRAAITFACAILTMVLLKRVYPIRFV